MTMSPSPELYDFVKQGLAGGKSAEELRASLENAGWGAGDIKVAFKEIVHESKPHRGKLWLWLVIGAVVLLIAAGVGALALLRPGGVASVLPSSKGSGDDAAANDADLTIKLADVPADQNAYFTLSANFDDIGQPWPDSWTNLIGGSADLQTNWNPQTAQEILSVYKDDLAAFYAAATKSKYQDPLYADPAAYDPDAALQTGPLRTLIRVAALDAYTKAQDGDVAGGRSAALLIADYGKKMADSREGSVGYLNSLNITRTGLATWQLLNALAPPSDADMAALSARLDGYADTSAGLAAVFKVEYLAFKKHLQALRQAPAGAGGAASDKNARDTYLFEINKTLNKYAETVRADIAMTTQTCQQFTVPAGPSQEKIDALQKMDTENAVGQLLLANKIDVGADLNNKRCDQAAYISDFRGKMSQPPVNPLIPPGTGMGTVTPASGENDLSLSKNILLAGDNAYLSPEAIDLIGNSMTAADFARADSLVMTADVGDTEAASLAMKGKDLVSAFVASSAKPGFQIPGFSDPAAIDAMNANTALSRLKSIGNLVVLDVNRLLASGDAAGADYEARALIAYGQKIALSQTSLNGYAIGMAMRDKGLDLYAKFKSSGALGKLPTDGARKSLAIIGKLADTGPGLAKAMKMNYWLNKLLVSNLATNITSLPPDLASKINDSFYFDAEKTLDKIAAYEREGIAMANGACLNRTEPPSLSQNDLNQMARATFKNVVGEYIVALVKIQSNEYWNNWRCRQDTINAAKDALSGK
jgi:hypothetical protein